MKKRLVCNVGINDADYVVQDVYNNICPFYQRWKDMLQRCYSQKWLEKYPTYVGCSVTTEWHRFSTFKAWMEQQDWECNQLDKDILCSGNKIYSPNACVFIPNQLNKLLSDARKGRGAYPLGVHYKIKNKKYCAQVQRNGVVTYLGLFDTVREAHRVWQEAKIKCIGVALINYPVKDPRFYPAIERIIAKLQDDIDNDRETISFHE